MTVISGKKEFKAEIVTVSGGFSVSVGVVVDNNTAILIRTLRKSDTPIGNSAKPTDIPAIGEKLALVAHVEASDKKVAEEFGKKLLANIENPGDFPEYAEAVAKKAKKAGHKLQPKPHDNKTTLSGVKNAGRQGSVHGGQTTPAVAFKGPGGAKGA